MKRSLLAVACLCLACPGPDRTPPTVTVTYPADNATLRGTVTVSCRATDNDRVTAVELLVDGARLATDSSPTGSTFSFELNTAALDPDSAHRLAGVGFDPAGNSDTSAPVRFYVSPGTVHRGTVGYDQTWTPDSNPHVVQGELFIAARVVVQPGVEVQMSAGSRITVLGRAGSALVCPGTAAQPVRFASRSLVPAPGDWLGIEIEAGADSCRFEHCRIEHGGGNGRGMVWTSGARLAVSACSLGYSAGHGVVVRDSSFARFDDNRVYSCLGLPVLVAPAAVGSVGGGNACSGNARDGVGVSGGQLPVSITWPDPGMPYYIVSTVTVGGWPTAMLAPAGGCSLCFADSAALRVGLDQPGGLVADGTSGPVVFAGFDSSTGWQGIEFWDQTDARSQLRDCVIDRGGGNGLAALICRQPVSVHGTAIRRSASSGVSCSGPGFVQFAANTVTGCARYPLTLVPGAVNSLGAGNNLAGNGSDSLAVTGGSITLGSQWRNHGIPYLVTGRVSVGSDNYPVLVIDPGTTIAFAGGAGLEIGRQKPGTLAANGLAGDSITCTGTAALPGAWQGIELYSGASSATSLTYCRLLHGGGAGLGILYVERCLPLVEHNEIAWSSNYCVCLIETLLDPDQVRERNWLHDWNEDYDDIFEEGLMVRPGPGAR